MKQIMIGICCLCCLALALSAGYFITYPDKKKAEMDAREKKQNIINEAKQVVVDGSAIQESGNLKPDIEPVIEQESKIDMNTKYQLTTVDIGEKTESSGTENIPNEWLGMNRDELIKWMHGYVENPPIYEINNGLLSFELVSFSPDLVKAKKTYLKDMVMYKYFIGVRNNMVVVYYSDKKTVYEYTGIDCKDLPMEEQKKLNYGIYVRDEAQLYGILEDYSS